MGFLFCRDWSAWLPRLKTTFLHLFVIYASVPFLIRLFPVLLTKCVFLNMCKYSPQPLLQARLCISACVLSKSKDLTRGQLEQPLTCIEAANERTKVANDPGTF